MPIIVNDECQLILKFEFIINSLHFGLKLSAWLQSGVKRSLWLQSGLKRSVNTVLLQSGLNR